MSITMQEVKVIKSDLAKLKPAKLVNPPDRELTNKEIILALAPELNRMKKRGFGTDEILKQLKERGINVSASTMNRYLNEARRTSAARTEEASPTEKPGS